MSKAAQVEIYVSKRPYIKEALAEGIVNYSALARKIGKEKDLDGIEAVKAALSRYEEYISKERMKRRQKVEEILDQTSLEVRSGVKTVKQEHQDSLIAAKTANGYTSVIEGNTKAMISLKSPEKLEETPGVIEFILSSLAAEGINVDHFISCREDTHIIVKDEKAADALEILRNRIKQG